MTPIKILPPLTRSFMLLLMGLVSASVWSAAPPMSLDIDGLYGAPSLVGTKPSSVAWSPDSSRIAFAWNHQGGAFRDVWTWAPGSPTPTQLTQHGAQAAGASAGVSEVVWLNDEENSFAYALDGVLYRRSTASLESTILVTEAGLRLLSPSPDGRYLAWAGRKGISLLNLNKPSAEPVLVLALNEPARRVSSLQWSANNARLAYVQTDSSVLTEREIHFDTNQGHQVAQVRRSFPGEDTERYLIGVIDAAAGSVQSIARPNDRDYIWNYGLSSDGGRLFVNGSDLLVKHHRIDVYDVATGKRSVFYEEHDPKHLRPDWRAAWAPDDDGLIILTDRDGFLHLYHQKSAKTKPRALTSGAWEIAAFEVDATGQWIYFLANRSHLADKQLYRVRLTGGEIQAVSDGSHGTHQPVISPDGQQVVSLFSDDRTPHELVHIDAAAQSTTRITHSPLPAFDEHTWADVRYIEFPSRVDGTPLVGRLSLPPNHNPARRYPLIVGSVYSDSVLNQWGGRQSHPTWGLDQYLVAQGYVLLNVNMRGSWGQGRAHNQGLRYGYGIVDIEDLHSGVEYLVREAMVDPKRVGIWGSSYGGLMTMMSLFKKPGVYAAGIAGAPATNVAHAYPGQMWVMGEATGDDQPQRYQSQSPLYHSAGLADPLMIIHGTRDQVVLYADTMAVVQNLIEREQGFELLALPGVGHGWDNEAPEVRRFAFKKMVEFFNRHLQAGQSAD